MSEPITGWALARGSHRYCGATAVGTSVVTACAGRWSVTDNADFLVGRDRDTDANGFRFDKCGACDAIARGQRTEDGLRELAANGGF